MVTTRWRVLTATGEFKEGGFYTPTIPDGTYTLVDLPDEGMPDPRLERYDATSPTKRRAATAPETAAYDTAERTARFTATTRQKDVLMLAAAMVRERGLAAWNAMSAAQKKTAVLAQADVMVTLRDFIETNL